MHNLEMIDLYSFNDYRAYIKARVKMAKDNWGLWAKLAKAASCRPTYLSQSMKGQAQLTPEHLIGLAKYFKFTEQETDFFMLLLELSRAGSSDLKAYIQKKMARVRKDRENLSHRLEAPRLEGLERESVYYSAWYWIAIHVLVSIPEYRTPRAISERLLLPVAFVGHLLEKLSELQMVKFDGRHWQRSVGFIHLPADSAMIGVHHNNWRQRAVTNSTIPGQNSVHYTALYPLSKDDYQRLTEKIRETIESFLELVVPSESEELACFACDLFWV